MQNQLNILKEILAATKKCLSISSEINNVEEIKKTIIFNNLITNLFLIRDLSNKLNNDNKKKYSLIDWNKLPYYDNEIINDYHSFNIDTINIILNKELPILQQKIEQIIDK